MIFWLLLVVGINWGGLLLLYVYPLAMLIWKDFVFDGWYGPFAKFRLVTKKDTNDPIEPWHAKMWKDWWGIGLGLFMCYRYHNVRGEIHEGTHCWQWAILGLIIFILAYKGHVLWILITQKIKGKPYTKHAYLDCWAERMARSRAGQTVNILPKDWMHGKGDLLPWF